MKTHQSLYLLAADQDFRLLRGLGQSLVEISHHRAADFPDVKDHFSFQQSRGHTSGVSFGVNDHGAHEVEERRRFARHAIAALKAEWAHAKDDRIILAAGPKMLGVLRDLMPKALAGKVAADLAKDLVKIPLHDLPSHFADLPTV